MFIEINMGSYRAYLTRYKPLVNRRKRMKNLKIWQLYLQVPIAGIGFEPTTSGL